VKRETKKSANSARGISWYTHPVFEPYARSLGQLALTWNSLHESLSFLFSVILTGGFDQQSFSVWHELKADRAQRGLLVGAVKGDQNTRPTAFRDDLLWLCGQADRVEESRNDAVHSPLWVDDLNPQRRQVQPRTEFGHKRAKNLATKNLLAEFRWCRDYSILLGQFADDIRLSLTTDGQTPWPHRPKEPRRVASSAKSQRPRGRREARLLSP
jgi:hypothetical protein